MAYTPQLPQLRENDDKPYMGFVSTSFLDKPICFNFKTIAAPECGVRHQPPRCRRAKFPRLQCHLQSLPLQHLDKSVEKSQNDTIKVLHDIQEDVWSIF
jgi:hypothetical protein